ncbi:MAG: hypothetical protein M3Q63_02685 [bacterium]|nr:hypothetical protein [bacterium]
MKSFTALLSAIAFITVLGGYIAMGTAEALTISPARIEVDGDPGKTIEGKFFLVNEQEDTRTYFSSAENFEAQGESGTPNFIQSDSGLASWIAVQKEVTLNKGEQKEVPFTITIPQNAEAGGHFAAIFLSTTPITPGEGELSVGAKIGTLILLRVSGDVKEGGGILDFTTQNGKRVFVAPPINFIYRFKNDGNDRVRPEGNVVIKNLFGMTKRTIDANSSQGNILPGSTRKFDVLWNNTAEGQQVESLPKGFFAAARYEFKNFAFGPYSANLLLSYGNNNIQASESFRFFAFPWHLLVITVFGLVILLLLFTVLLRKYNRWIISKVNNNR